MGGGGGGVICSNSLLAEIYEICDLIGYYFVKVVEELDSHNLGVGALQGDILLVDLKLRPDALVSISPQHCVLLIFQKSKIKCFPKQRVTPFSQTGICKTCL
jgi:hypothetical protein